MCRSRSPLLVGNDDGSLRWWEALAATSETARRGRNGMPTSCATMKPGTSIGLAPAKVSVAARARARDRGVGERGRGAVNQYAAAVMYRAPTANGTAEGVPDREQPQITGRARGRPSRRPCSTTARRRCARGVRRRGRVGSNIRSATATPTNAPAVWVRTYGGTSSPPSLP